MEAEGIAPSAISAFESTFNSLVSGNTGIIPESTISPAPTLDNAESFSDAANTDLLKSTVVLKLNGGLGTGMGLDKAKSLLKVKGDDTFLDLTAKQIVAMREEFKSNVKFMLMNSFSTSADTLAFFQKGYPSLAAEEGLEMMQNKVPKIDAKTYEVRPVLLQFVPCISLVSSDNLFFGIKPLSFLFVVFHCLSLLCFIFSLLHARVTHLTNGAHPDTEIFTLLWRDPAAWMPSSRMDINTCLFRTLTTWEHLWTLKSFLTLPHPMLLS